MGFSQDAPSPLFAPDEGGVLVADPATRGPWDPGLMHGGAPSALLAGAIQVAGEDAGAGMTISRFTVEFLAGVPVGPVEVAAEVVKPGKRFQLVEGTLSAAGRPALLARAVRLRVDDAGGGGASPVADVEPLPPPEDGTPLPPFVEGQEMFYPLAMSIRQVRGTFGAGAAAAWFRLEREVLAGQAPTPLQRAVAAADFTNGLSWILPWDEWTFVNTDLTVHLHRDPVGEWVGLDARTEISPFGTGLASGSLYDEQGAVGTCAQTLFVSRR